MPRILALAVIVAVLAPGTALAKPQIVDLGQAGSNGFGQANAVNAFGEVVGLTCSVGRCAAFRWTRATGMVDLGSLGGTKANAIYVTPFGTIVGSSSLAGDVEYRPFVWSRCRGMVAVEGSFGGDVMMPYTANDWGQIVGYGPLPAGGYHAFSWTPLGGMVDLGTLGGQRSYAEGVGNGGHVVGYSSLPLELETHGFVWTQQTGMVDVGTLGGILSTAEAVNGWGQVVGGSAPPGNLTAHAFSWTPQGGMIDLGAIGGDASYALLVNDAGQVAGTSGGGGAFVWTRRGGMIDLGSLGGGGSYPYAMSRAGQVIGFSLLPGGKRHAFSWTRRGGMVDLGTLSGGDESIAYGVNDAGMVVGMSTTGSPGEWRPVLWTAGR